MSIPKRKPVEASAVQKKGYCTGYNIVNVACPKRHHCGLFAEFFKVAHEKRIKDGVFTGDAPYVDGKDFLCHSFVEE